MTDPSNHPTGVRTDDLRRPSTDDIAGGTRPTDRDRPDPERLERERPDRDRVNQEDVVPPAPMPSAATGTTETIPSTSTLANSPAHQPANSPAHQPANPTRATGTPVPAGVPVSPASAASASADSAVAAQHGRHEGAAGGSNGASVKLLSDSDHDLMSGRWKDIQTDFVDAPQKAVENADALVAELMQHIARTFSTERKQLEEQWSRGDQVSTEDLRVSLQRYRTFFQRLLAI